jgi:sugar phosphate isomerase/epimerase
MGFPLACADFTFPLLPHHHALDLIAMLGFEGVDIGLFEGRSHLQPSTQFSSGGGGPALGQQVADRGLRVADVFLQLDPDFAAWAVNHPDPARRRHARDMFLRTLEFASGCGSRHVTILPGVSFPESSPATSLDRCREELAWRAEEARMAGLCLGIEPHVGSIVSDPRDALALVHAVPHLTLTLDFTHFIRAGLTDDVVEPLVPVASHLHVRGARPGRLQCSFADNTIDYGRVLERLAACGYPGFLGIEYVWIDWEHCNEADNLSETILFRDDLRSKMA